MNKEEKIKILQDVMKINTENNHEQLVAEYYQQLLKMHGIESKLVEFDKGRSSLVAEISNGPGRIVALSGHMDVVSAGDESKWTHPPFSGYIEDGILWGRGASDMKSGLTALIIAMIELNQSKSFNGTIRLLATVGEEIGELGSRQLTDLGYMDNVEAMIIGEPCNIGVVYAHKGSLNYKVVSKGTAAHSSSPELGNNAIANLMIAMDRISERISKKTELFTNEVLGKAFHNITLVSGGSQVNSIPDYAEYEANARTIPEFDNDALMKEVCAVIDELNEHDNFELMVKVTADQPPVETNPNSRLIEVIIDVASQVESLLPQNLIRSMGEVMGVKLEEIVPSLRGMSKIAPMSVSGTTDAAQFIRANPNLELAVYGPGMPMLNHKIDERIPLSQYLAFIDVYKNILEEYMK